MGSLAYMLECATNSKLPNTEHTKVNTVSPKKMLYSNTAF